MYSSHVDVLEHVHKNQMSDGHEWKIDFGQPVLAKTKGFNRAFCRSKSCLVMSKMWSRNLHIYKNGIILIKVLTIVCQLILTSNYYSTYQRPRASRLVTINKFISCVAEYIEIFPCWHFRFLSVLSYSTIDVCREL